MNSIPTFVKELTLRGRINVELLPTKDWRTLAVKGIKRMSYRISGDAEIQGEIRHVNVHIPAIVDGNIVGIGEAVPRGSKDGTAVDLVSSLCPKQATEKLGTAKIKVVDGASVIGEDGLPVFEESITQEDGTQFPMMFGCHYFCPSNSGLTLMVTDAAIKTSDRAHEDGSPYLDVRGLSHEVVPASGDRACGAPVVKFTAAKQAARQTKEAEAAPATSAAIRM